MRMRTRPEQALYFSERNKLRERGLVVPDYQRPTVQERQRARTRRRLEQLDEARALLGVIEDLDEEDE